MADEERGKKVVIGDPCPDCAHAYTWPDPEPQVANQLYCALPHEPKVLEIMRRTGRLGTRAYVNQLGLMTHEELVGELVDWALDVWHTQLDTDAPNWYVKMVSQIADAIREKYEGK